MKKLHSMLLERTVLRGESGSFVTFEKSRIQTRLSEISQKFNFGKKQKIKPG